MSTCISRHGEYGSHTLDAEYTCTLCGVLDEDALIAELKRLRVDRFKVQRERDRMRPVVEAAETWAKAPFASNDMPALTRDLVDAIDAYRSSTPDAEPAPGVPVDTEEGQGG